MTAVRLIVPAALILFFLWRGRRQPIFVLGVPLVMASASSLFADSFPVIWLPMFHDRSWSRLAWLVLAVLVALLLAKRSGDHVRGVWVPRLSLPEELAVVGLFSLVALVLVAGWSIPGTIGSSMVNMWPDWGFLIAGYVLVRVALAARPRDEILLFLDSLAWVGALSAVLFLLDGAFGLPIYDHSGAGISFAGKTLSRSFGTMPAYYWLMLAAPLSRRHLRASDWALLGIALVAVLFTYTRSFYLGTAMAVAAMLALHVLGPNSLGVSVKRAMLLLSIVALAVFTFASAFPAQSGYALHRLTKTTLGSDPNALWRRDVFEQAWAAASRIDPVFGVGFSGAEDRLSFGEARDLSVDNALSKVAYDLGVSGLVLVALCYVGFVWRSVRLARSSDEGRARFGVLCVGLIVPQVPLLAVSSGFLDRAGAPLGFFALALVASEAGKSLAASRSPQPGRHSEHAAMQGIQT